MAKTVRQELASLGAGDHIVVKRGDPLFCSVSEALEAAGDLAARGIRLRVIIGSQETIVLLTGAALQ